MTTTLMTKNLAAQAFERRDYGAAVGYLCDILEEHPGNAEARELLARAYYHRASLPHAEEQLRIILDRDPTDEYATLLLARTLERQSRHDEAAGVRRVLAALTGEPRHAQGYRPI
ncbi:MAG: tetratricopeptide repeat protein [Arachnia sp.]